MKVFLSHSHRDTALVREIRSYLPKHISTWLDEDNLLIGVDLDISIRSAIQEEADFVVIFLGQEAMKSKWIKKELEWAMEREKRIGRVFVLPILLDDIWDEIEPEEFRNRLYLKCFDQSQENVREVAEKLGEHLFGWLSRHLDAEKARELEEERRAEVSKQAQETLISLTKDEIWDQARAKNLVRTYKELTFNLQGLPDEIKLLRVKERLQKEIASFRERIAESNGNSFMERLKHYSDSSNDLEAVHKRMLDVISVAVWQNVKKSTEEHYNLLQELLANITLLEQRGSKAADILDHVRQFLVQSEHRNFSESA